MTCLMYCLSWDIDSNTAMGLSSQRQLKLVLVIDFYHGSTPLDISFFFFNWRCMCTLCDLVGIARLLQQGEGVQLLACLHINTKASVVETQLIILEPGREQCN